MHRLFKLIRHLSQHHRQEFFYSRENEIYRQKVDSYRDRVALIRFDI
jgi:hypothetical protein